MTIASIPKRKSLKIKKKVRFTENQVFYIPSVTHMKPKPGIYFFQGKPLVVRSGFEHLYLMIEKKDVSLSKNIYQDKSGDDITRFVKGAQGVQCQLYSKLTGIIILVYVVLKRKKIDDTNYLSFIPAYEYNEEFLTLKKSLPS